MDSLATLQETTRGLAELDVLGAFAERADSLDLTRPEIVDEPCIDIRGGRHLVVEQVIDTPFVANDLHLDATEKLLVITGPNMGGKSTYMRQAALITVLAHIGSFVPGNASADRSGRSDLYPHRCIGRHCRRAFDIHGGDDRDSDDPEQRDRIQSRVDG